MKFIFKDKIKVEEKKRIIKKALYSCHKNLAGIHSSVFELQEEPARKGEIQERDNLLLCLDGTLRCVITHI